jgi:hypothetical protein
MTKKSKNFTRQGQIDKVIFSLSFPDFVNESTTLFEYISNILVEYHEKSISIIKSRISELNKSIDEYNIEIAYHNTEISKNKI